MRTSGRRIKGGPEQSVTMADAQLLEWDIPGDDDAAGDNGGTTSGSSKLWEEAFGTETQAGLQVSPYAGHISRQRRSFLVPRALSSAKQLWSQPYKDEYNRFSRDLYGRVDALFLMAISREPLIRFTAAFLFKHPEFGKMGHSKTVVSGGRRRVSTGGHSARSEWTRSRGFSAAGVLLCVMFGVALAAQSRLSSAVLLTGRGLSIAWAVSAAYS